MDKTDYETMKEAVIKHGDDFWQEPKGEHEEDDHNIHLLKDVEEALAEEDLELVLRFKNRCQRCRGANLLNVSARSKDMNDMRLLNNKEFSYSGYSLGLFGEGGDNEEYTVCLDCGQMQGTFPYDLDQHFKEE